MTGPLDLDDISTYTGWTCPAPRAGDTPPTPEVPPATPTDPLPSRKGPTLWPATADTTSADLDHWWPTRRDDFPVRQDPALDGRPPAVALKPCGCGVLNGEDCDCAEMAAQLERANRTPILFGFRRAAA